MEWLVSFQHRFGLLQRALALLIRHAMRTHNYQDALWAEQLAYLLGEDQPSDEGHDSDEQDQPPGMGVILDDVLTLSRWVWTLPQDEAVWRCVTVSRVLDVGVRHFYRLRDDLEGIGINEASPLHDELNHVGDLLLACPLISSAPALADSPIIMAPAVVTDAVWLTLFHQLTQFTSPPLKPPTIDTWSPVVYHPATTNALAVIIARYVVEQVPGRGYFKDIHVTARQTPAFFELALTRASVHLRPDVWETLLLRLPQDYLERLRAMGGQIEPLTWDEGQGEGVIMRLPWVVQD